MIIFLLFLVFVLLREKTLKSRGILRESLLDINGIIIGERITLPIINPLRSIAIEIHEVDVGDGKKISSRILVNKLMLVSDTTEMARISTPDIRNHLTQLIGLGRIRIWIREDDRPKACFFWTTRKQAKQICAILAAHRSADCDAKKISSWQPN